MQIWAHWSNNGSCSVQDAEIAAIVHVDAFEIITIIHIECKEALNPYMAETTQGHACKQCLTGYNAILGE
jgi:hypothetical protein